MNTIARRRCEQILEYDQLSRAPVSASKQWRCASSSPNTISVPVGGSGCGDRFHRRTQFGRLGRFGLGQGIEIAEAALQVVGVLLEVGHLGLPHRLLELALEFGGHFARLAHPLPDHAQHARQLFRADGDQRDNRDDNQFTPPDVEHERFRSREAACPDAHQSGAVRVSLMAELQALLPTSERAGADDALL